MTTVVNNPTPAVATEQNSFLIGLIVIVGSIMMIWYFGVPMIQRMGPVQLNVPAPQVVIPEKIDVSVNQAK